MDSAARGGNVAQAGRGGRGGADAAVIGGELAQSRLGLPKALTSVFQGLLLFALLACDSLIHYRVRRGRVQPARAAAPRALPEASADSGGGA